VLGEYHARHTGGAAYRRMAERAVQECEHAAETGSPAGLARLAAEQCRLRQEVERLQTQQRAVLAALQAMGARRAGQAGAAREEER